MPARWWRHPLRHVEPITLSPHTRLIISVGGCGAVVGAALARQHRIPIVQVQNPRTALSSYDLIVANVHDGLRGDNVCSVRTALHGVTEARLAAAQQRWSAQIRQGGRPVLGVLLGGSNGRYRFGVKEAEQNATLIKAFIQQHSMTCVVTSSRRTDAHALSLLKTRLEPHGVRFLHGEGDRNPYMGILACSDCLAVTMDSVSMISEAVATSLPVGILPLAGQSSRIGRFIETLEHAGRVQSFNVNLSRHMMEKLDDTAIAADEIWHRIKL